MCIAFQQPLFDLGVSVEQLTSLQISEPVTQRMQMRNEEMREEGWVHTTETDIEEEI